MSYIKTDFPKTVDRTTSLVRNCSFVCRYQLQVWWYSSHALKYVELVHDLLIPGFVLLCFVVRFVTEMEDDFSQSLTPPVSPSAEESYCASCSDQPPCFSCALTLDPGRDETKTLSSEGYVSRGALKRYCTSRATASRLTFPECETNTFFNNFLLLRLLLKLDPAPGDFETDCVDIFGFSWVTETALVESTKLLFGLFR